MSEFGEVCELLAASESYGHWQFDKVVQTFLIPVAMNQALIFRRGNDVVGVITYAYVSDEALEDLVSGKRRINIDDWRSGENIFFPDIVAPFGSVREMMRQTQQHFIGLFGKGVKGHWYRPAKERSGNATS